MLVLNIKTLNDPFLGPLYCCLLTFDLWFLNYS
jgi:hypothetical protein